MKYLHGADQLRDLTPLLSGKRLGLVTNHTGLTSQLIPTIDVLRDMYDLRKLYAPEHGVRGAIQAGGAVPDEVDPDSGLPVYSLYGAHAAGPEAFEGIDCVLFDIQDLGARFYTYMYTLIDAMKRCAQVGVPVIVLDRYNPLGLTRAEGTLLDEHFSSGVGRYELPTRHALSMGEFARYANERKGIGCELRIIPCQGLTRKMDFRHCGVPWALPSPNIPTWDAALCYIGTCLFEGTNLSEGRGTTKPFEMIGAPWLSAQKLAREMNALNLAGVRFRGACFTPTFSKHAGQVCQGVQLHITDPDAFDPFRSGLMLLHTIRRNHPEFCFLPAHAPGGHPFIDLLVGGDWLRDEHFEPESFIREQQARVDAFQQTMTRYYLYE